MIDLVKYSKYHIKYKRGTDKLPREGVMVFLGEEDNDYIFSARPAAGNQKMPKEWVLEIVPADEMTEVYVEKIVRE